MGGLRYRKVGRWCVLFSFQGLFPELFGEDDLLNERLLFYDANPCFVEARLKCETVPNRCIHVFGIEPNVRHSCNVVRVSAFGFSAMASQSTTGEPRAGPFEGDRPRLAFLPLVENLPNMTLYHGFACTELA